MASDHADRAQSEVVGTLFLIGVVVLVVTAIGVLAFDAFTVPTAPNAELEAEFSGSNATVSHGGGDALALSSLSVVTRTGGESTRVPAESSATILGDGDDSFELGERLRYDCVGSGGAGSEATLRLIHEPSSTTVLKESGQIADGVDEDVVFAVNSGGDETTGCSGATFDADRNYTGGNTYSNDVDIAGTTSDSLYTTERWAGEKNFSYDVGVDSGEYRVTFKLAEVYFGSENTGGGGNGSRVFDIFVEDERVVDDLDIHRRVGANTALDISRRVNVTDGELNIRFEDGPIENAKSGAVLIERLGPARPTYDPQEGPVVMETEQPSSRAPGTGVASGSRWKEIADSDATAGSALDSVPDSGVNADDTTAGPRLDYEVDFEQTGTYYVWVRTRGPNRRGNSVHLGLDGEPASYGGNGVGDHRDRWVWENEVIQTSKRVTVTVDSSGVHTVNVWMREDGTQVDKLLLTQNASYTPTGTGPPTSSRASE